MYKGELAHLVRSITNNRDQRSIRFGVDLRVKDILDLHRFEGNRANRRYRVARIAFSKVFLKTVPAPKACSVLPTMSRRIGYKSVKLEAGVFILKIRKEMN